MLQLDKTFTTKVVVLLGFWHVVKVAAEALWSRFLNTFLAPAFHVLYPTSKVLTKPKLSTIFQFFNLLAVAYPSFRDQLLAAKEEADSLIERAETDSEVEIGYSYDIKQLYYLLEHGLPLVCFFN